MPATTATVDSIMKEVYGPRLEDQLQNETKAIKRIERTSEGVVETTGGKYVDFPIRVKRNHGIGARKENEQLPQAGKQGYAEVHVPLNYLYGRCEITGQVMELAEKNYQAFASAMDREMEYLKDDLQKDTNRQAYGTGTGILANVSSGSSSSTQSVDSTQYFEIGMIVDVVDASNGSATSNGAGRTVESIDEANSTVTLDQSVSTTTSEAFVRAGNYGNELSGLETLTNDSGVLHNVDPASQPQWKGEIDSNGGTNRALSENLMINLCDQVRKNGGKTSVILTSLGVRRSYFNLLTQQRRYTDTKNFEGGFQGLAFNYGNEIPVVEDVDCPPNTMFFIEEGKIKVYRNREWHWADLDGSVLKWVNDYDAWEAFMRCYKELGTTQRNAHGRLEDITED